MAKKSNKTEQVLKLITKDEETIGKLAPREAELVLKEKPPQELRYEAKLTIEIDPEVELKQKTSEALVETVAEPVTEPVTEPVMEPVEEPEEEPVHEKKPERNRLDARSPLLNISEVLVREKAPDVMDKMRVCTCPACASDVLALALNTLPTKYVTTDEGKQFLQLEMYKKQYETDVLAALTRACVRVKASPRH